MSFFKKVVKDASKTTENLVGNMASSNAQNATNAAVDGMDLFRWKIGTPIIQNGHFDQQKGNLFEYIEAAKFNADAASKGMSAKAVVTDVYDQGAAADILIKDGGRVQKEVQAKFVKSVSCKGIEEVLLTVYLIRLEVRETIGENTMVWIDSYVKMSITMRMVLC